jgi:hypothetical protein
MEKNELNRLTPNLFPFEHLRSLLKSYDRLKFATFYGEKSGYLISKIVIQQRKIKIYRSKKPYETRISRI